MEAPEKIYFSGQQQWSNPFIGLTYKVSDTDIEYTRTDAFVEKACEWIKMMWSETDDRFKEDYTGMLVENFKNYIKGE